MAPAMKRPAAAASKTKSKAAASGKAATSGKVATKKRPAAASKASNVRKPTKASKASRAAKAPAPRKMATEVATPSKSKSTVLAGLTALLLGLERRPDRRERCEKMLHEHAPWLNVEFFRATDGKVDVIPDVEVAKTWNTKCNSLYGAYEDVMDKEGKVLHTAGEFADPGVDYEFSPGERGCAHSHHRMWQRVAGMEGPMLILEDDVQIDFERSGGGRMNGDVFKERLELGMKEAVARSADVVYLGWSGFRDGNYKHLKAARGKKSSTLRKAEYVWTTVAYVLWPAGARKLLERARPMDQPVDNFMGWESREGRLSSWVLLDSGDTDDTWAGGIVTQLDFNGDSDIKKSDGGDQGDDPTAYLAKKPVSLPFDADANMDQSLEATGEREAMAV